MKVRKVAELTMAMTAVICLAGMSVGVAASIWRIGQVMWSMLFGYEFVQ